MGYKLTITFGGLCLFVEKTRGDNVGLYVLMPRMNMAGMVHCTTLIGYDGKKVVWHHLRDSENLLDLADAKAAVVKHDGILEMSNYGQARVDPACFTDTPPGALALRIALPLGSAIAAFGDSTMLTVPQNGGAKDLQFAGQVNVTVDVPDGQSIKIGGVILPSVAGANGQEINVIIANATRNQLAKKKATAVKGRSAEHIAAYYNLLENPPVRPDILHAVGQAADPDPEPDTCPTEIDHPNHFVKGPFSSVSIFFGDPANCTVGWGCQQYPCP